jgi:hypothetical protein
MPTVDIPDKVCPHCGGTKWKIEREQRSKWLRIRYRCAKKGDERAKKWVAKNPEKVREYNLRNLKKKRDSGYYKSDKLKEYARLKSKRESDTLADNFVLKCLTLKPKGKYTPRLKRLDITPELMELKRKELLLTRQIKAHGKAN